jgi:hypothetical protein
MTPAGEIGTCGPRLGVRCQPFRTVDIGPRDKLAVMIRQIGAPHGEFLAVRDPTLVQFDTPDQGGRILIPRTSCTRNEQRSSVSGEA